MKENSPDSVLEVIQALLGPKGCPWDKEQTPESLCDYLVEETFELVDALRRGENQEISEELGDVFFILFFLSHLLQGRGAIHDLAAVWADNARKMKRRHPHVFSDVSVSSPEEVNAQWETIKRREKESAQSGTYVQSSINSIPSSLPPLLRAYRLHAKAAKAGFTWAADQDQEEAVRAEWAEWTQALSEGHQDRCEEEFGDLLFSLVESGRRQGIKANAAVHRANIKFVRRFQAMLDLANERDLDWDALSMEQKDALWQEVKQICVG